MQEQFSSTELLSAFQGLPVLGYHVLSYPTGTYVLQLYAYGVAREESRS